MSYFCFVHSNLLQCGKKRRQDLYKCTNYKKSSPTSFWEIEKAVILFHLCVCWICWKHFLCNIILSLWCPWLSNSFVLKKPLCTSPQHHHRAKNSNYLSLFRSIFRLILMVNKFFSQKSISDPLWSNFSSEILTGKMLTLPKLRSGNVRPFFPFFSLS